MQIFSLVCFDFINFIMAPKHMSLLTGVYGLHAGEPATCRQLPELEEVLLAARGVPVPATPHRGEVGGVGAGGQLGHLQGLTQSGVT